MSRLEPCTYYGVGVETKACGCLWVKDLINSQVDEYVECLRPECLIVVAARDRSGFVFEGTAEDYLKGVNK